MVAPMVAAAAIQAGSSLLGGIMGNSSAKKQAKEAQRQFNEQMAYTRQRDAANDAFSAKIFEMVPGFLDRTYAQEDYYRQFNDQQRLAAQELMNYLRGFDTQNARFAQEDYDFQLGAQTFRDQAAAEQRRYDLERIARNENLAASERQWAIQQLMRERGVASTERAQEASDIADFQAQRQAEYQDRYSRLMEDRITRASERAYEQNKQDMVISQAGKMREAVQRILQEQGQLRAPELQGPEEIAKIATERGRVYTDIMDKLSERQMSQLEAALIKRGMDTGGDSGERRAEMVARLAPEYQKALLTAQQEAVGIVDGNNKTLTDRFNALRQAREIALNEAQLGEGAGLDMISRLGELGSGVLDRDVGSGAEYIRRTLSELGIQSPVGINSGIYDDLQASDGISQWLGLFNRQQKGSTQGMGYDLKALPSYEIGSLINSSIAARGGNGASLLDYAAQNRNAASANYGMAQERLGRSIDSIFDKGVDWLGKQESFGSAWDKITSVFGNGAKTPGINGGYTGFGPSMD